MLIILIELHKTFTKLKICYESRNDHVVYNKKVFFSAFFKSKSLSNSEFETKFRDFTITKNKQLLLMQLLYTSKIVRVIFNNYSFKIAKSNYVN